MITRKELETREKQILAPYAFHSCNTRGRKYAEPEHLYRNAYDRDKGRIIYSTAFRRLEYKTQVFVNHEGGSYRTRLTHTMEVAHIAKTIAKALKLNDDLVETIALAHDLGHTPFGHAGEKVLNDFMKDHGGFEHNCHGLRVVDVLEKRTPLYEGLNLSYEVREGIIRHNTFHDHPMIGNEFDLKGFPPMEVQVVDIADEIAYDNHDVDDGLMSGHITEKQLSRVSLWNDILIDVKKKYPKITLDMKRHQVVRALIDKQVTDVISNTEKNVRDHKIKSVEDVKMCKQKMVIFSPSLQEKREQLKDFLMESLYRNYRVLRMSDKACRFLKELFCLYLEKPEQLPPNTYKKVKKDGEYRVICDYIAGMTDRYALEEYKKLFDPFEKV